MSGKRPEWLQTRLGEKRRGQQVSPIHKNEVFPSPPSLFILRVPTVVRFSIDRNLHPPGKTYCNRNRTRLVRALLSRVAHLLTFADRALHLYSYSLSSQ